MQQKNIFVVVGFWRSGTSAITRGLKALGIDLGEKLVKATPTCKWNPTGFWEDEEIIYSIHAELYAKLNHAVRSIPFIESHLQLSPILHDTKLKAIELLENRFQDTEYWAFKYPSASKVLTFWQDVFASAHIQDHYIIALRNPLSCAYSYHQLTGIDLELALILWLMHMIPAVDNSLNKKTIIVSYDALMQNPKMQLLRIKQQLKIPFESSASVDNFCHDFLNSKLQHNQFTEKELISHPSLLAAPLCVAVYQLLSKLATDKLTLDSPVFRQQWGEITSEMSKVYPIYYYLDKALRKHKLASDDLKLLKKSFILKLTYPIRIVENILRKRRYLKKGKKRILTAYEN